MTIVHTTLYRVFYQTGLVTISLLLVAIFAQSCSPYDTEVVTPNKEQKNIPLPDGSFVLTNAGTKVYYNADNFQQERVVELEGEAKFFVRRRDNGFLCKTKYGLIYVLGTQFNVYARPDGFAVSCYSGKVEVRHKDQRIQLGRNEKVVLEAGELVQMVENYGEPHWVNKQSAYQEAPFRSVIAELERQYDIAVKLDITGNPPFTGGFPHYNLQQAMDNIVAPYGYNYEQQGREMRIWEP